MEDNNRLDFSPEFVRGDKVKEDFELRKDGTERERVGLGCREGTCSALNGRGSVELVDVGERLRDELDREIWLRECGRVKNEYAGSVSRRLNGF